MRHFEVQVAFLTILVVFMLQSCSIPPQIPVRIERIQGSPPQMVGKPFLVTAVIETTVDAEEVLVSIDPRHDVGSQIIVSPPLRWSGAISETDPGSVEFELCVAEEGTWPVLVTAILMRAPTGSGSGDRRTFWVQLEGDVSRIITSNNPIRGTAIHEAATPRPVDELGVCNP